MMVKKLSLFLLYSLAIVSNLFAFNLRKTVPDTNGSIIHSIYQDIRGLIWLATNTGLSTFDGKKVSPINGYKGIKDIYQTSKGEIYAETLYGLKILNPDFDFVTVFDAFNNIYFSTVDSKGTSFIIQNNGSIFYRMSFHSNYDDIIVPDIIAINVKAFFVDENDVLRVISNDGTLRSFEIQYNSNNIYFKEMPTKKLAENVLFCFVNENHLYLLDKEYTLRKTDLNTYTTSYIDNLKPILTDKGEITSGIIFKKEFYFGTENGLFVIRNSDAVKIPIKARITQLLKDKHQDLIWIGTMGDGIYTYSYDQYSIKSNLFSDFSTTFSKPVSAIYLDNKNTLWVGTEGDGIVLLPKYNLDAEITTTETLSIKDGLPDNTIYSLYESEYGMWIGCKSGLAFYSYKSKNITKFHDVSFVDIRDIYEDDLALWLACYGKGITEINVHYINDKPEFQSTKLYSVSKENESLNRFSSICVDNGNLVFINTGNGVFRISHKRLDKIEFADDKLSAINHIMSINKSDYIAATDFGTYKVFSGNVNVYTISSIASKDIVPGQWGDYWLSTDNGLMVYSTTYNTFRLFDNSYGLTVTEYINGVSFKDKRNGILFFGGVDGFTTIRYNDYDEAMDYMPALSFEKLELFGIERNIRDFTNNKSGKLIFKPDENFFSVTFDALDYINGNNYLYYYRIGNGLWVENGNSGTVSFTGISPGDYEFYIRYYNKMLNKESYSNKLSIRVLPPWYQSVYAYIAWFLLGLLAVYIASYFVIRSRRKRKEEEAKDEEQRRKEEIYEAKLDFFTDIAHEFCTPLTLISGPCNLILNQKNLSSSVQNYANVINRNAQRMNSLISDLMEFKRMESGYRLPEIAKLNISEISDRVTDAFRINASGSNIPIAKQYCSGIIWNSDEKFLTTILINLISNAVKYSSDEPVIIEINIENENLILKVTNRGEGIPEGHITDIFNRFSILNNGNQNDLQQNGLGLTITGSMVKLLSGHIEVNSTFGEYTSFIVTLPLLQEDVNSSAGNYNFTESIIPEVKLPPTKYQRKEDRLTVTIIDDDPEMLWLIGNALSDEFNILPVSDSSTVIETLSANHTDIILCDIMMNNINGIELTKLLKSDKSTSHIPLIIISAVHDIKIQTDAINAGAELYITKPFNIEYLKTTIRRLLGRKEDLKDYFASPLSAYEQSMGKLQHMEHRKFLKRVHKVISDNVQNKDLSPDFIATELGMSTRTLYRKLKEVTDKGLLEIIRDGKLAVAENLLSKSKYTIDEIIFKSGFTNRASFYRAFSNKNGCSPSEFIEKNNL